MDLTTHRPEIVTSSSFIPHLHLQSHHRGGDAVAVGSNSNLTTIAPAAAGPAVVHPQFDSASGKKVGVVGSATGHHRAAKSVFSIRSIVEDMQQYDHPPAPAGSHCSFYRY